MPWSVIFLIFFASFCNGQISHHQHKGLEKWSSGQSTMYLLSNSSKPQKDRTVLPIISYKAPLKILIFGRES